MSEKKINPDKAITENNFDETLKALGDDVTQIGFRHHELRHTCATRLIEELPTLPDDRGKGHK